MSNIEIIHHNFTTFIWYLLVLSISIIIDVNLNRRTDLLTDNVHMKTRLLDFHNVVPDESTVVGSIYIDAAYYNFCFCVAIRLDCESSLI